jgi:hypothetical protein
MDASMRHSFIQQLVGPSPTSAPSTAKLGIAAEVGLRHDNGKLA